MAVVTREHILEALKQVVDTDKGGDVVTLLPVMANSGCSAVSPRTSAVGQKADVQAPTSALSLISSA